MLLRLSIVIYPIINKFLHYNESCSLFCQSNKEFSKYFFSEINILSNFYFNNYYNKIIYTNIIVNTLINKQIKLSELSILNYYLSFIHILLVCIV